MTIHTLSQAGPLPDHTLMLRLMDNLTQRVDMDLASDVDRLRQDGWLSACVPTGAGGVGLTYQGASLDEAVDFLLRLGGANIALGRLFEGHANACKLVHSLATQEQANGIWTHVLQGALMGVWGADGRAPVKLTSGPGTLQLSGEKSFCSGLGLVSIALVSAQTKEGLQLILADVSDVGRADARSWQLSGMQATRSGTYDFEALSAESYSLLGSVNVYYDEPHFHGGQWRYLALHAGAIAAIAQEVSCHLRQLSRDVTEAELMRLARIVALGRQSFLWAKSLATETELIGNAAAGTQAILGREQVEQACLEAMTLAERTIGTQAFTAGSRIERLCRDLRTYLRQAALDQRLIMAGKTVMELSPTGQQFLSFLGALPSEDPSLSPPVAPIPAAPILGTPSLGTPILATPAVAPSPKQLVGQR